MAGDLTDIDEMRVVVNPAHRSVDVFARGHHTHTGEQAFENACATTRDVKRGQMTDPLMTLRDEVAFSLFKDLCKVFADDFSVLEFSSVNLTMNVKSPGAGGGRFIPAGAMSDTEMELTKRIGMLERLLTAKDENLADLRRQVSYTCEDVVGRDPNVPLTVLLPEEGF